MKTMTITAVMALLVVVPLVLKKKRLTPVKTDNLGNEATSSDENERYAIDDFLT